MTSLEALESLMENYYEMCQDTGDNDDNYQRYNNTSEYHTIKKDLEVLKIIKANKNIIFSKKPKYENMNADEFFKLSRWLEE